jgi:hypothetical protein
LWLLGRLWDIGDYGHVEFRPCIMSLWVVLGHSSCRHKNFQHFQTLTYCFGGHKCFFENLKTPFHGKFICLQNVTAGFLNLHTFFPNNSNISKRNRKNVQQFSTLTYCFGGHKDFYENLKTPFDGKFI